MAIRVTPNVPAVLYIEAWLVIRKMLPAGLAAKLKTSPAAVSRWIAATSPNRPLPAKAIPKGAIRGRPTDKKDSERIPDAGTIRAIEEALDLRPGALFRSPTEAPEDDLLAGLAPKTRDDALTYIDFLRQRDE